MLLGAKCSEKGPPRRLVFLGREARRHRAGSPFLATTFTYALRAHLSSAAPCTTSHATAPPSRRWPRAHPRGAPLSLHVNLNTGNSAMTR